MLALIAAVALQLPALDVPKLPPITRDPQVTFLDRSGQVIGVRGGRYAPPVDVARLPKYVPAAFVAIEDKRFYEHSGFDVQGIARALVTDLGEGRAAQGASTITQQLARNLFLSSDKSLQRKGEELIYAVELEQAYSKPQILGLYLSRVYFGGGAYGIEAAAERYFGVSAAHLTIREAATLAALMKSPVEYSPVEHPEASAERTRLVLDAMVESGAITQAQRNRALAQSPKVFKSAPDAASQYFVDWVDAQFKQMGPPKIDLIVETTLDARDEAAAQAAATQTLDRYARDDVSQAALVSLDPQGRVRAMVGGADYARSAFNRAVDAHRQAGSSWKPFVYLTVLEAGRTPDSPVVDQPVTIDGWSPKDFEPEYLGQVTLQTALAQSINTVAASLADEVGRPNVAATAHRLGIVTQINTEPAMALGTSLVTPIEMAQAYDALSNGGDRVTAFGIERIRTVASGRVLWTHPVPNTPNVIGNPPLGELDQMMRQVLVNGTGVRAAIPGYDLAGKTGTTSDFRDAWFDGFTGGLTTVVWMGNDDNSPTRNITGGLAPAEFWKIYMRVALKRTPVTAIPPGPPAASLMPAPIPVSAPPPPPGEAPPPRPPPIQTHMPEGGPPPV
ncbi:MAG TPA: PBP1A family penicillin-binding protein [Caulobacteraceae bacterium]